MIHIVHLITGLNVGGAERVLANLVRSSDGSRFRHVVVSMIEPGPVGMELAAAGAEVHGLGMRRGVPSIPGLVRMVRILRRSRPCVLQCWMYHANLLGLLAGKWARVPHIVWGVHSTDLDFSRYRRLTRWVVRACAWLSRFPDSIVVVSEAAKKDHESWGYPALRMVVIPNGFDLDHFRPDPVARVSVRRELYLADEAPLVGLIARFHPKKDHQTFLRAAAQLHKWMPDVRFLLAGAGVTPQNPELCRAIRENELEGFVFLLGRRNDVARLMASLDILSLSSSFGEAFPLVVGEAMACGVPCVVTDVGDSAFIVGDTGSVVLAGNPEALARGLADMMDLGSDGRKALGQRARQRVEARFSQARMVEAYESLYERLVR